MSATVHPQVQSLRTKIATLARARGVDYPRLRLVHRGGLGERPQNLKSAQIVHIDLGIGDPVTPAPLQLTTKLSIGQGGLSWQVYPPETILAETLHALVTIGSRNSRSKDVYDVDLLLGGVDSVPLAAALKATFAFRGDPLPPSFASALAALERGQLRRGWDEAVRSAKDSAPFDETLDRVIANLKAKRT